MRAFKGSEFVLPEKKAKARVERWLRRCKDAGYLSVIHAPKP